LDSYHITFCDGNIPLFPRNIPLVSEHVNLRCRSTIGSIMFVSKYVPLHDGSAMGSILVSIGRIIFSLQLGKCFQEFYVRFRSFDLQSLVEYSNQITPLGHIFQLERTFVWTDTVINGIDLTKESKRQSTTLVTIKAFNLHVHSIHRRRYWGGWHRARGEKAFYAEQRKFYSFLYG
jgi:hypothetical protein